MLAVLREPPLVLFIRLFAAQVLIGRHLPESIPVHGCPVQHGMFNDTPGLYPLAAS